MSETQPLDFFIAAQNLTAIGYEPNHIVLNVATGTEVGKLFDFLWAFSIGDIMLKVKGKFVDEMTTLTNSW